MATRKTSETDATTGAAGKAGRTTKAAAKAKGDGGMSDKAAKATTGNTAKAKAGAKAPAKKAAATKAATGGGQQSDLRRDLRQFVEAHPGGWGHNEWIGLVNHLRDRGHETRDTDAIGMALERERLKLVLERIPGLGAKRVDAIADQYPRIWNLMQANAEEIATAASIPQNVAEKVRDALR